MQERALAATEVKRCNADTLGLNEIKRDREVKEHHRCCSEKVSSNLIMSRNAGSNQLMQLIVNMYKYLLV